MLNNIVVMGRITRDIELRNTPSGIPVAAFSIAVERDYKSGEEKQTDFIHCVAWRHNANFLHRFFSKGRMAIISGRLQIRKYTDSNGNNRELAEVVCENIYFADAKNQNNARGNGTTGGRPQESYAEYSLRRDAQQTYQEPLEFQEMEDDDGPLPWE